MKGARIYLRVPIEYILLSASFPFSCSTHMDPNSLLQLLKLTIFSSSISLSLVFHSWTGIISRAYFSVEWKLALLNIFYQKLISIHLSPKIKGKPHLKCWICLPASYTSWEEIQDTAHWEECPHCVMGVWVNPQHILTMYPEAIVILLNHVFPHSFISLFFPSFTSI